MGPQVAVALRSEGVSVPGTSQDGRNGNASLQTLLTESDTLELRQGIPLRSTVDSRVLQDEDALSRGRVCGMRLKRGRTERHTMSAFVARNPDGLVDVAGAGAGVFDGPDLTAGVVLELGTVVALVQELEDAGKNLWDLIRKRQLTRGGVVVMGAESRLEERRCRQDFCVSSEESRGVSSNRKRDCGRVQLAGGDDQRTVVDV